MKKIKFLSIIPVFLLLGLGTTFSNNFTTTSNIKPICAEEEPAALTNDGDGEVQCVLTVDKYKHAGHEKDSTIATYNLDQNTNFTTLNELLKANYEVIRKDAGFYSVTTVSLKNACDLDLTQLKTEEFVLALNGFCWKMPTTNSWYITNQFTIKGGDIDNKGVIIPAKSGGSGLFYVDHVVMTLTVENTAFRDFNTGRYPIFEVVSAAILNPDGKTYDRSGVRFINCSFTNCRSSRYGGCVYTYRTEPSVFKNCEFKDCHSKYGGALYLEDINADTNRTSEFENLDVNEVSADYGGFMYVDKNTTYGPSEYYPNQIRIYFNGNCLARNCCARYDGGFAYIDANYVIFGARDGRLEITGRADRYGGGIYINRNGVSLNTIDFYECKARYGGGIYINGKNADLYSLKFSYCMATKKGGSIYSEYPYKSDAMRGYFGENDEAINEDEAVDFSYDEEVQPSNNSSIAIWVMGSIVTAALIGCTVTICLVFRKKKPIQ